jgi:hypothetical protein
LLTTSGHLDTKGRFGVRVGVALGIGVALGKGDANGIVVGVETIAGKAVVEELQAVASNVKARIKNVIFFMPFFPPLITYPTFPPSYSVYFLLATVY